MLISKTITKIVFRSPKSFIRTNFEGKTKLGFDSPQWETKYADRPRGDLSEYNHRIHGLTNMTNGMDLEVLKAWERGDFKDVIAICDDTTEITKFEIINWNKGLNQSDPNENTIKKNVSATGVLSVVNC